MFSKKLQDYQLAKSSSNLDLLLPESDRSAIDRPINTEFFSNEEQAVLSTLRKPNSIKEWNELVMKMVQANAASGTDELEEVTEVFKVRNRRLYQRPINGYTEYYLRFEPLNHSGDPVISELAQEVLELVEKLEFCEKQIAQFESADQMIKERRLVEQQVNESQSQAVSQLRSIVSIATKQSKYVAQKREQSNQSFIKDLKGKYQRMNDRLGQLDRNYRALQLREKAMKRQHDLSYEDLERESPEQL